MIRQSLSISGEAEKPRIGLSPAKRENPPTGGVYPIRRHRTSRICLSRTAPDKALVGGKLVRLDRIALKGFAESRWIYAFVPDDDPGLATFVAGRQALDQHRLHEGFALLNAVNTGVLAHAAKVIGAQNTATIESP